MKKHYLLASDFDRTLSFNDSGIVLREVLGLSGFRKKVAALARLNLVQQGADLAYLLRHDPEYCRVTKTDLLEEIVGWGPIQIRALFERHGLVIQEWDRTRTDWLTIRAGGADGADGVLRLDAVAEG
ncbi:MAG: hypothetical protein ACRDFT_03690 [bacterium]